jgi:hypothetical protein
MSLSDIITFYTDTEYVQEYTDRLFKNMYSIPNWDPKSYPNAFKHTFLAALRTIRYGATKDRSLMDAREVGEAIDRQVPYDPEEIGTKMDNKNNLIGIALGSNFNGRPEDLIPIIYNMAKNGQLWTIEGNNVVQKPF